MERLRPLHIVKLMLVTHHTIHPEVGDIYLQRVVAPMKSLRDINSKGRSPQRTTRLSVHMYRSQILYFA